MPINAFTINEVSERIGVGASTIRNWGDKLGIEGRRTRSGKRLYTETDLSVLEIIKQLREQNSGFETIRRRIDSSATTSSYSTVSEQRPDSEPTATSQPIDGSVLIAQVIEAIGSQTDLSQKYAAAAHQIGRLEAENEFLKAQIAEAQTKIEELQAPKSSRPWWKIWK